MSIGDYILVGTFIVLFILIFAIVVVVGAEREERIIELEAKGKLQEKKEEISIPGYIPLISIIITILNIFLWIFVIRVVFSKNRFYLIHQDLGILIILVLFIGVIFYFSGAYFWGKKLLVELPPTKKLLFSSIFVNFSIWPAILFIIIIKFFSG